MRRSRPRLGRALFLSFPLLSAWACGDSDKEKLQAADLAGRCSLNSDCRDPLACTFQRCHNACEQDRDCRGEERCVKGDSGNVCQLPDETACTRDADCSGDQQCGMDGECRDVCADDDECVGSQICAVSGECASTETDKDLVSDSGEIMPDPFDDTGEGGATGTGGKGSTGGMTSTGGKTGSGGITGMGGAGGAGGTTGEGGVGGGGTTGGSAGAGGGGSDCPKGLGDCDGNGSCETGLDLITSCGACGVTCDPVHGKVKCDTTAFMCVIDEANGGCDANYDDCNDDAADGCEAALQTDSEHCGVCGTSCGSAACVAGKCMAEVLMDPVNMGTLYYQQTGEAFLVGDQVYKLNTESGTEVKRVTLPAESPPTQGEIFATASSAMYSVYADATNLYWSLQGNPANVFYKPLSGTASTAARTAAVMPASYAYEITASGTALYLEDYLGGNYRILTVPKPSGTAMPTAGVVTGLDTRRQMYNLTVAGTRLFWSESSTPPAIYTAPLAGGTPVAVDTTIGAYPQSTYTRITTDNQYVYWNTYNGTSSKIRRVAVAGSPSEATAQDVAVGLNTPEAALAVDETYVYFLTQYQVFRVKKDGTESPESLVNLGVAPYFFHLFAADDGYVYGTGNTGELLRVSKGAP